MRTWLVLSVFLSGISAHAYVGAISSATAEAGRASIEPTDSPFMNPAALPFMKGYFFTTGFNSTRNSESSRAQDFALALTDNMTETIVPTSLAFTQSKADFASEDVVSRDFLLSFGNFVAPHLALGLGVRYKDDQLPSNRYSQVNFNIGTLYAPTANIGFAAVFENVAPAKPDLPPEASLSPKTSLGVSYIYRRFLRSRFDIISDSKNSPDRPILAAGFETYWNKWAVLRLGVQRRNEENANAYTAGLGFQGPRFGVHYAYLTSPEQESLTRHSVDLAIPIW